MNTLRDAWNLNFLLEDRVGKNLHFRSAEDLLRQVTELCEERSLQLAGSYHIPDIGENPENTVQRRRFFQQSVLDTSRPLRLPLPSKEKKQIENLTESARWLFRLVIESSELDTEVSRAEIEEIRDRLTAFAVERQWVLEVVIQRPQGNVDAGEALLRRIDEIGDEIASRRRPES